MSEWECEGCHKKAPMIVHESVLKRLIAGTLILWRQRPCEDCGREMVCEGKSRA